MATSTQQVKPAKAVHQQKKSKAPVVLTVIVLLALTLASAYVGMAGLNLDKDGLYKLLPWIPMPTEKTLWRQALPAGSDLGTTTTYRFVQEGEGGDIAKDAATIGKRLSDLGLTDAVVKQDAGALSLVLPQNALTPELMTILTQKGQVTFETPEGQAFMAGDRIVQAGFAPGQTENDFALQFSLDAEGKKIFAEKTAELVGQSIKIVVDGETVSQPRISAALTEGQAAIPGFTQDKALGYAVLLRSGPLSQVFKADGATETAPLLGAQSAKWILVSLYAIVLLVALCLILRYRLSGFVAAWSLAVYMILAFFLAALMNVGFSIATLVAVFAGFLLTLLTVLSVFSSMKEDIITGRSLSISLREAYKRRGRAALDVLVGLLLLAVVWIIMDTGSFGAFMRLSGAAFLVALVVSQLVLRLLMQLMITLTGDKTALFFSVKAKKEA